MYIIISFILRGFINDAALLARLGMERTLCVSSGSLVGRPGGDASGQIVIS
jgi:hypothetical protein